MLSNFSFQAVTPLVIEFGTPRKEGCEQTEGAYCSIDLSLGDVGSLRLLLHVI